MELEFAGEIFYWRGPAPFFFVAVAEPQRTAISSVAREVTYGWGVIPVLAQLGDTKWTTSLFPKAGGYLVPVKAMVRKAEDVDLGDLVSIRLTLDA